MIMLKLMKYEYKKNRGLLLGLLILVVGLEIFYLINYAMNEMERTMTAAVFLVLATVVSFYIIFFLGISNYDKELKSKSSYLIFMTPNSSLKIIISKLLYVLLVGTITAAIFGSLAVFDIQLLAVKFNEKFMIMDIIEEIARNLRVNLVGVWSVILLQVVVFVINFFSIVAIAYFAITLASTFLQNNRFKGIISVVLFILLMLGVTKVHTMFFAPDNVVIESLMELVVTVLPTLLYNGVIMVACVFGCSFLLDRAVSL